MKLTLDLDFSFEKKTFSAFMAGDGDSGIKVEGKTERELVNELMPYIKDYVYKTQREYYIGALERATIARGGHYDLSEKELIFFDDDTEEQKGESCNVLSLNTDEKLNLSIEVDYYGGETWEIEDLTDYEVKLLFEEIWDADKKEPKFKDGDWVVNKFGDLWHIDSFDKKNYQVSDGKGNYNDWYTNGTPYSVHAYCGIKPNGNFELGKDNWCFCGTLYMHPATKEQRDQLKKAMADAEWEFDFDKKELKNIEPKFKAGDWV